MPNNIKKDAKQAGTETAKRKKMPASTRAGRKAVAAYLTDAQREDFAAIAAAVNFGITNYASKLLADHIAANPELVAKGREKLANGECPPYQSRRVAELEEENAHLRKQLANSNPTPC